MPTSLEDSYRYCRQVARSRARNFYYSFLLLDPWPGNWDPNWYDADDLYIDWDEDGYYLYNRSYPDQRLAVTIVV